MDSETARAVIATQLMMVDAVRGAPEQAPAVYMGHAQELLEASYRDFPPPADAVRPPEPWTPPMDGLYVDPNALILQPTIAGDALLVVSKYVAPSLGAIISAAAKAYAPTDPNGERWLHIGDALLTGAYPLTTTFFS